VIRPYIVDSWAVLAWLQREEPAGARVQELFKAAFRQEAQLLISIMNIGEAYYRVGQGRGKKAADDALQRISRLPLTVVPVDNDMVIAAAGIKMAYPIAYADAFAVEVARRWEGTLVTGDRECAKVQDLVQVEWLHRSR